MIPFMSAIVKMDMEALRDISLKQARKLAKQVYSSILFYLWGLILFKKQQYIIGVAFSYPYKTAFPLHYRCYICERQRRYMDNSLLENLKDLRIRTTKLYLYHQKH